MEEPSILELEAPTQRKHIFFHTRRTQFPALLDPRNQDCQVPDSVTIKQLFQKKQPIKPVTKSPDVSFKR